MSAMHSFCYRKNAFSLHRLETFSGSRKRNSTSSLPNQSLSTQHLLFVSDGTHFGSIAGSGRMAARNNEVAVGKQGLPRASGKVPLHNWGGDHLTTKGATLR